ncbi:MAG: hypothetical protein ABI758_07060 [Candidatus Woesebacteria bacterium]
MGESETWNDLSMEQVLSKLDTDPALQTELAIAAMLGNPFALRAVLAFTQEGNGQSIVISNAEIPERTKVVPR